MNSRNSKRSIASFHAWILYLALFICATPIFSESAVQVYRQGEQALSQGDRENARYYFRRALEINPSFREAALSDADLNLEMGDPIRARQSYDRVLSLEPKNVRAHVGIARLSLFEDKLSEAEKHLLEAEKTDPSNEGLLHARGELSWRLNRKELAASYFEKSLRKNPLYMPGLLSLAVLETERGRTAKANECIERARRVDSENPDVFQAEGDIAFRKALVEKDSVDRRRLIDQARRQYRSALDIADTRVQTLRSLVLLEMFAGNASAGLPYVRTLIEKDGDNPDWQYLKASIGLQSGGKAGKDTMDGLVAAIRLEPADSLIRYRYEQFLLTQNEYVARKNSAKFHLGLARSAGNQARSDLRNFHVRRALMIDPDLRPALDLELERARRVGDTEAYLNRLFHLRELDPSPAVQFRIDEVLKQKSKDLALREGLLSKNVGPYKAAYQRSPNQVLVFDFKPAGPFIRIPDAPEIVASAIRDHLNIRSAPATESFRKKLFDTIRLSQSQGPGAPVYYSPEFIRFVDEKENPLSAIVSGTVDIVGTMIRIHCDIYDGRGARVLDKFDASEDGEDALHRLAIRVSSRINSLMPVRGQIIRAGDRAYINLGSADGVKKGDTLTITRGNRTIGDIVITESAYYVSMGSFEKTRPSSVFAGDVVNKVAKKTE